LSAIADFFMLMDLTNPDPRLTNRIVAMLGLGDAWICASPVNAKVVLDEFTDALKRSRLPPRSMLREHIVDFPANPSDACDAIAGFAMRVYGGSGAPSDCPPYTTADIDRVSRSTILRWSHKQARNHQPTATGRDATLSSRLAMSHPPVVAFKSRPTMHANTPWEAAVAACQ
jgi:hypothetical protein